MTDGANPREIAVDVLLAIEKDGEYSHIALRQALDKYQYLEKQERAWITRLVEGTLERQIRLDYILEQFSRTRVAKMKPMIRCILRSGAYQICFLDGVPDSAACNEAVKLAKKRGFATLGGFVNGVLRNLARQKDAISYSPREPSPERFLSVWYSIPEWIIRQWAREYGWERTEEMAAAILQERPLSVRVDTGRISPEQLIGLLRENGVEAWRHPEISDALCLSGYDRVSSLPGFAQGFFYVQDISSMRVARAADPQAGDVVVDVCAAPGGKSIHIAQLLHGTGHVEARDISPQKVARIEENMRRCQVGNMSVACADARVLDPSLVEKADIVIADLPCSGLGVIGRKKDIRYKMTEERETQLVALQREILGVSQAYVKPGGKLVYSTCTVHRAENEENVAWLEREYPKLRCISQEQIFPQKDGGDGFFIACLVKGNG